MRALLLAAVLIGIGCKSSVEPTGPLRPEMYGYYYLETVNGESLPYSESDAGGVLYTFHSGQITLLEDGECSNSIHWQYEWEDQLWEDNAEYVCFPYVSGNTVSLQNLDSGGLLVLTFSGNTLSTSIGEYQLVFRK